MDMTLDMQTAAWSASGIAVPHEDLLQDTVYTPLPQGLLTDAQSNSKDVQPDFSECFVNAMNILMVTRTRSLGVHYYRIPNSFLIPS